MFIQRKHRQYVSKLAFQAPMFLIHSPESWGNKNIFKGRPSDRPGQIPLAKIFSVKTWFCNFKIQDKDTPKKVFE